jgi:HicA-like toxin of HicAB toxin-antitoxin system
MNERLPALSARDCDPGAQPRRLRGKRTSGSHCRFIHATDPARKVTVPVHSGDLKRGTLRGIIAQAGMTVTEFLALLYSP